MASRSALSRLSRSVSLKDTQSACQPSSSSTLVTSQYAPCTPVAHSTRAFSSARNSFNEQNESLSRPRRNPEEYMKRAEQAASNNVAPQSRQTPLPIPKTEWDSPVWQRPAPPTEISRLVPTMSGPASKANGHYIAVGPGAHNRSDIRTAERALHLHMQRNGHRIGPAGKFRGVEYRMLEPTLDISASHGATMPDPGRQGKRRYMESVGGDYSRYQPSDSEQDVYDWKSTAEFALAGNTSIPPESRAQFHAKVQEILEGRTKVIQQPIEAPKKEKAAPPPPPSPVKGAKGGKRK